MSTAIVIPTYNEAENLPRMVEALFALPIDDLRILVMDDYSPDGTGQIAEELGAGHSGKIRVIHRPGKMGLGSAYISGFKELIKTDADYIVQMDADFSHPPEKVVEMIAAAANADIVLGSRYVRGGRLDDEWPLWRKALSSFGNLYARTILNGSVHDLTGGFRLWKREILAAMPLDRVRSNGYVFQVEMLYVAEKLGFKVVEIPIYFAERKFGESKMNLSIQLEAATRVWQLRSRYRDL